MAALKKGVSVSVGLVTASVSLYGAVEKAAGNTTVCCGDIPQATGKSTAEHDPIPLAQVKRCSTCGDVPYDKVQKARRVGEGLVLLNGTEIADAKVDATKYLSAMACTPHPVSEVYARTAPGEKVYYLTPDPGHEVAYDVLRHMIGGHPELAFVTLWTPRSNATQFRLVVREGTLMATELVGTQKLKAVPQVTASAPGAMLAMAEQVLTLPGVVTDYDPDLYADTYEDNIQALLATKQVVAAGGAPTTAAAPAIPASQAAAMAALEAMLAAAAPAKPAPKKRTTKAKVTA